MKAFKNNFALPTVIFSIIGGFFLLRWSKSEIHLAINAFHNLFADVCFTYLTYLGEGFMFVLAIPVAMFYTKRAGIHIALSGLVVLLLTAIFKQWLFSGEPRPIEYFKDSAELYFVPGVRMNHWNSFPSGHTMAAFALYGSLAFYGSRFWQGMGLFALAFFIGYSRMYLSQHFLVDVVFGALFGTAIAFLGFKGAESWKNPNLDTPLIKRAK